jgi:hypothetical protein
MTIGAWLERRRIVWEAMGAQAYRSFITIVVLSTMFIIELENILMGVLLVVRKLMRSLGAVCKRSRS